MLVRRNAADRGTTNLGWLDSRHSFSFGHYFDPKQMGFRGLRVINDDRVAPGGGFGTHPHENMEIISIPVSGALAHRDSTGGEETVSEGEIQVMHAGTGITHSEFNAAPEATTRFLQIWIVPDKDGHEPGYHQGPTAHEKQPGSFHLSVAPAADATEGVLPINADARIHMARLEAEQTTALELDASRHAWLQVMTGEVEVNGLTAAEGDGIAISGEDALRVSAHRESDVVLFDLA